MGIKKFSHRLTKSYRLIGMMVITASLLGTSYGYWSDENTIQAGIQTPKVELECDRSTESIEVVQDNKSEENITLLNKQSADNMRDFIINVEAVKGRDSVIPIEYFGYEIYFINMSTEEEKLLASQKDSALGAGLVTEIDVDNTGGKTYKATISINSYKLNALLSEESKDCKVGGLKIKLHFKQKDISETAGWKYSAEMTYPIRFLEPQTAALPLAKLAPVPEPAAPAPELAALEPTAPAPEAATLEPPAPAPKAATLEPTAPAPEAATLEPPAPTSELAALEPPAPASEAATLEPTASTPEPAPAAPSAPAPASATSE